MAFTIDRISTEIDKGNCVIGLFLDLKKAFDTVHHDILFQKLNHYGIRGGALELLKSYLHNRNQAVKLGSQSAHLDPINLGSPRVVSWDHCFS